MARSVRTRTIGADLNRMSHEIRSILFNVGDEVIEELAEAIANEARTKAPVISTEDVSFFKARRGPNKSGGIDSGPLKENIIVRPSKTTPHSVLVNATPWYAHFVEYGTDPHKIRPKKRRGVSDPRAAYPTKDGKVVWYREVKHPGAKKHPFLRPAAAKAEKLARMILKRRGLLPK